MNATQKLPTKRSTSSLVTLTKSFVQLMKNSGNGILDLKYASRVLNVQKRRIYDITNVLQGVGLIGKGGHSSLVQWRGRSDKVSHEVFEDMIETLTEKEHELRALEKELDYHLKCAKQSLSNVEDDPMNKSYLYITRDDMVDCFGDSVILSLRNFKKYETPLHPQTAEMHVKTDYGCRIDVRLVSNPLEVNPDGQYLLAKSQTEIIESASLKEKLDTESDESKRENSECELEEISPQSTRKLRRKRKTKYPLSRPAILKPKIEYDVGIDKEEKKLLASIILRDYHTGHSKRTNADTDTWADNDQLPLLQINPPKNIYNFALENDEGVCELFDIPYRKAETSEN